MNAHRTTGLLLSLIAGIAVAIMATPLPLAASNPPRWGEPVSLGEEIPSSWFPDIQADSTGTFRLVWTSNLAEGDGNVTHATTGAVMFSQLGEAGWGTPRDIQVMDAGIASRPLIASDGIYAHMVFRTGVLGTVRLFYCRAPLTADLTNAHSWSEPQPISSGEAYYAQIAILPDGTLVVAYNAIPDTEVTSATATATRPGPQATPTGTPEPVSPRPTVVFSRRSIDRGMTWSFAARASDTPERIGRVALAAHPDGKLLIVAWDEGYDNLTGQGEPVGIGTARSADGGLSWRSHQEIRSGLGPIEQASVEFGGEHPILVYRANGSEQLLYRIGLDGGERWSEERQLPGAIARPYTSKHNFDKLGLARDGDGRVLLAYVGRDATAPKGLAVMVATYADDWWTVPERVAAPDGYPEYPRIAVALGNQLQLVYFVRDKEFDIGHYVLYTVAGQSNARTRQPVVPAPAPAAIPAPTRQVPAVLIQVPPTRPPVPAPLRDANVRLDTPQAEVTRPAMQTLLATLLLITSVAPIVLISRWLRVSQR